MRTTNQVRYAEAARPIHLAMLAQPDNTWDMVYPFYLATLDALVSVCYGDFSRPWTNDWLSHRGFQPRSATNLYRLTTPIPGISWQQVKTNRLPA